MTQAYVCIHGHFYQPPRETPWSGVIEHQPSAHPHHDWNERITEECYRPNTKARILDGAGNLVRSVNTYSKISFDFGPTLLSWLEKYSPEVYRSILEADRVSQSGLAQVYNHMIVPLAVARDRVCQVVWGARDFEHRFGRRPDGMWLPETAVDLATLEALADVGIRFTILAPHQARHVRPAGADTWRPVDEHTLDTTLAYEQRLPSGRRITLFFYDGPVSRAVAFEGLLEDGARFADRLRGILPAEDGVPRLAHIATDGESYGHHHKFGEMALASALDHLNSDGGVEPVCHAAFLDRHPVRNEVEIVENSSWSCSHGIERWRGACGCGADDPASLSWRAPLRESLDWLRDAVAPLYERKAADLVRDPWKAREESVDLWLGREDFFERHARRPLDATERRALRALLELQRYAMLMYTSCGWFFEDLSRIETIQVLRYAGRVVELTRECLGHDPEAGFLKRVEAARSAIPERGNGRKLYERHVIRREPADPGRVPSRDQPG